jgi:hypothetical protein
MAVKPEWVAAIGGILAAIAGGVSVYYAYRSADVAWRTLQSTTVYQIQKDSIDLAQQYKENKVGPGAIIAKMYSIYYQRQKGVVDDGLWPMLNYEYCVMMQRDKAVQNFWDAADKSFYGKDFTNYVSLLRGGQKCG